MKRYKSMPTAKPSMGSASVVMDAKQHPTTDIPSPTDPHWGDQLGTAPFTGGLPLLGPNPQLQQNNY